MTNTQSVPPPDLVHLRRICADLARWAFTDFELARTVLNELEETISPRTPFDIRLA